MEGKTYKCECCNITLPFTSYENHLKDKRHRLREKMQANTKTRRVFMAKLPEKVTKGNLMDVLKTFGDVRFFHFNFGKRSAIAEFESSEAAEKFLKGPVQVLNTTIYTAPGREPQPQQSVETETLVDSHAVIAALEDAHASGITDLDKQIKLVIEQVRLQDPPWGAKILRLRKDLQECISQIIPGCTAIPFGSVVTGLALKGSDADIVIAGGNYGYSTAPPQKLVRDVRRIMFRHHQKFINILALPEAKTPIVKCIHVPTKISCDISFYNAYARRKNDYLNSILGLDERIRPLIIFIKHWAKCKKLISTSRFSSHALTLMVIFYLQQLPEPLIPPFCQITVYNIPELRENIKNADSLSKLVQYFFSFYADLEAGSKVLCPWVGDFVHRGAFGDVATDGNIPTELNLYRNMVANGATALETNSAVVLQDPFDWEINVTGRVTEKDYSAFRKCCAWSVRCIERGELAKIYVDSLEPGLTLRAEQYLMPKYFTQEHNAEAEMPRKNLFELWTKVVFILIRHFLSHFVRIDVKEEEKEEPRKKTARTSEQSDVSEDGNNKSGCSVRSLSLLCSGHAVAVPWQMRKKVASALQLQSSSVSFMKREALISEYLVQKDSSVRVEFNLQLDIDSSKELICFTFNNCSTEPAAFLSVCRHLRDLIPLWLKNAFDSGASLRCVSGTFVPLSDDEKFPNFNNRGISGDIQTIKNESNEMVTTHGQDTVTAEGLRIESNSQDCPHSENLKMIIQNENSTSPTSDTLIEPKGEEDEK